MTLTEALEKILLPPGFSLHITVYQNSLGEQRAKVEFKGGKINSIDKSQLKEILLEILPEAHYDWFSRSNALYAVMTQCDYNYTITTRITKV